MLWQEMVETKRRAGIFRAAFCVTSCQLWRGSVVAWRSSLCILDSEEQRDQREQTDRHGEAQAGSGGANQCRNHADANNGQRISREGADEIARNHLGAPILRSN